jgi:hypothetical protein
LVHVVKYAPVVGTFTVVALSCVAVSAQAGTGLEPGVHADPGSPAAKEYALPLNQARQAAGSGDHANSGSAALFGSGIKPPGSGGSGGSGRADSRAGSAQRSTRRDASGPAPSNHSSSVPAVVLRAARSQASSSGSGSLLTLLGGGVAILVLGAFGGTVMRRSRRSSAPARPANSA